jgi:hypothetical protein
MERYQKLSALFVFLCASTAGAAKIQLAPGVPGLEDASLNINLQIQAWVLAVENQTPSGTGWNTQAFLRRIRPIISGDVTKELHFFVQFDSPNFGRNGTGGDPMGISANTGATRVVVQDAQIIYEPTPGIFIEAGELLLPLSHQQVQSTTSFVTLDLHSNTIRFPGATAPNQAANGLREFGVETRGWVLDKKLGFRLGAYNGVRGANGPYDPNNAASTAGVNPDGIPQFGGYLHFNFLDSEERGWLYQGVYFNNKPILSVGVGAGYQPKAIRSVAGFTTTPQDWRALSADVYAAFPLFPDHELIFQADGYNYDFGNGNPNTGNGFFIEAGYRIGQFQPQVSYEYFSANDTHTNDARIWTAGINWWYRRINSLKLEVAGVQGGNLSASSIKQIGVQWQLFF